MRVMLRRRAGHIAAAPLLLTLVLSACGEDAPIQRLTIPVATASPVATIPSPSQPAPADSTPLPAPPPTHPPVPVECSPPSAEPASAPRGSDLVFSGACSFTESGKVSCSTQPDDFLFQFSRDTPDGPKLYLQLNVEFYKGPGSYPQNVHVLVEIPDNGTLYEWDTLNAAATVDPGGRSGSLDNVTLPPDPGTPTRGTLTINGTFACV